jgi:hypothetical protein
LSIWLLLVGVEEQEAMVVRGAVAVAGQVDLELELVFL